VGNATDYAVTWNYNEDTVAHGTSTSLICEQPSNIYWLDKYLHLKIEEQSDLHRKYEEGALTFAVDQPRQFEFEARMSKTGDYIGPQYVELDVTARGFDPLQATLLDIRFSDQTEDLLLERYHPIELNKGLMCGIGETEVAVDLEPAGGGQLGSWTGSLNCRMPVEPPADSLYLEFPAGATYSVDDVIPVEIWLKDSPGDINFLSMELMINGDRFGGYLRFRSFEYDAEFWPEDTQDSAVYFKSGSMLLDIGASYGLDSYPTGDGPHRVATLYVRAKKPGTGVIVILREGDYNYRGTYITDSAYHDRSIEHLIGGQVTITE